MDATDLLIPAKSTHRAAIIKLLSTLNMPTVDLPESLDNFLVVENADAVIGSCGLEQFGSMALLRSLAVEKNQQGKGLGNLLYQTALDLAKDKGITEVYLITNTAADFFAKQGFTPVERAAVPAAIQGTAQFTSVCPSSATVMYKKII